MDQKKYPKLTRSILPSKLEISDDRMLEFSFSSEEPVERYFGREILSHRSDAADYSRLNDGAPLLFNHDSDKQLGVIKKAWIGNDNRGYVQVKFAQNQLAVEKLQDIKDDILRNVSVGYQIKEITLTKQAENEPDEYLVTKYLPFEVSFVTIPADNSVGVGRQFDKDEQLESMIRSLRSEAQTITAEISATGEVEMPTTVQDGLDAKAVAADAVRSERERASDISLLGEKYKVEKLARDLINSGKSLDEARAAILESIGNRQKPVPDLENPNSAGAAGGSIGMTRPEVRQYSFLRAINAMANPNDKTIQEAAKFEREVSDATSQKMGRPARGFMIPIDVLRQPLHMEHRDLSVGVSSAGGNLVNTEVLTSSFIDLLRNKSVIQAAGATVLNGLQGNLAIPRQSSGAQSYWVAEGAPVIESNLAFDQVTLSPKTVGTFVDYTRKLLLQSSVDIEAMIRKDLAAVIALEIDRAALYGTGSTSQPLGLKNVAGVGTSDFAANIPTFAEVVGMETATAVANADVETMKYIVNATGRGALKTSVVAANTGTFIFSDDEINGYQTLVSNQVAANDFWFGNWSDLILAFWSGLDILVDPFTQSTTGTVRVIAMQDTDVGVKRPLSFVRGNNTL